MAAGKRRPRIDPDADRIAVLYARVSSEDQAGAKTTSLDDQERRCREYAESRGWTVVDVFRDEGVTGTTANRPAWSRLLDEIAAGPANTVVCLNMDRFTRDTLVNQLLLGDLRELGAELWFTDTGKLDEDDDAAVLVNDVFAAIASNKRRSLLRTMANGAHAKARAGRWPASPQGAPFGLTVDGTRRDAVLVLHPEEAETVRRAASLVLDEGKSLRAVAALLNAEGRLPRGMIGKGGVPIPTRWSVVLLRRHLTRPALTGEVWWGAGRRASGKYGKGTAIPGVPAILTPERFAALVEAVSVHGPREDPEYIYPLSGRIKSRCGRHFNGVYRAGRDLRSYKCAGKRGEHREPACPCVWLDADPLESRVWEAVVSVLGDPERMAQTANDYLALESGPAANATDELQALKAEITSLETALTTGVANYLKAGVDAETMQIATASLSNDLAAKRARRDDIERYRANRALQTAAVDQITTIAAGMSGRLETTDPARRAELLRLLEVNVELLDDSRRPRLRVQIVLCHPPDGDRWLSAPGETPGLAVPVALVVP